MSTSRTVAIILADSSGLITAWDPGAVELVGYQPEEIVGRDVVTIVPEDYRARHRAGFGRAMQATARDEPAGSFHLPVLLADQTTEVFAARLSVLDDPYGRPVGAMVILQRTIDAATAFTPVLAADPR
jgi:PAS domain S-box-containing protein